MVHQLLPTQARLVRLRLTNQRVGLCTLCKADVEDIIHAFFLCPYNNLAGLRILGWIQVVAPDLSEEDVVQLNFGGALSGEEEVAVLQTLAIGLKYIWEARLSKKVVTIHQTRSEIESNISLIRKASRQNISILMEQMLNN